MDKQSPPDGEIQRNLKPVNPYVGPRPFQYGETLYGRKREAMNLLKLLIAERIVMLYSPSGAGKTSLVQAALIPRLEKKRFQVLPVMRVNQEPPQDFALPPTANRYVFSLLLSLEEGLPVEQQTPLAELATLNLADYLDRRQAVTSQPSSSPNTVLIFDQFEEILTIDPTNQAAKTEFFEQIGAALRNRRRWGIFALREDYIAGLHPFLRPIPTRLSTTFRLESLGKEAAHEAMQGPADEAGVDFTDAAAKKLVDDLCQVRVQQRDGTVKKQPGLHVEPVQLQVVCNQLWEKKFPSSEELKSLPGEARKISEADVEGVEDVDSALVSYYDERVAAVAGQTNVSEEKIRDWFGQHLITEYGIRGQVLWEPGQSRGLDNEAIGLLVDAHLVRAEKRRGATWYELAHDRFIEPIRESNRVRKEKRRRTFFTVLGTAVTVLIVGVMLASATTWTTQRRKIAATVKATEVVLVATAAASDSSEPEAPELRVRVRPLKPGLSVGEVNYTAGTISAFVRDAKGHFYFLTALHVLGGPHCELDNPVIQPGRYEGGTLDEVVGYVAKCLPLADGVPAAHMVGLARLKEGIQFETAIPGIGPIRGVREPTLGMSVRKLGRTTGLTAGTITQLDVSVNIYLDRETLRFENAIFTSPMSQGGDSGALVVDEEGYAIGVIFGGSQSSTIIAPIQDVLGSLDVELVGIVP